MAILFHYCDANALLSIITNKQIWLSPLHLSNDTMEGKVAMAAITEMAARDGRSTQEIRMLHDAVNRFESVLDCYGLCLSEKGDMLSQWRGYADDGGGFAIGFDADRLAALRPDAVDSFAASNQRPLLRKIAYTAMEHHELLSPWYETMRPHLASHLGSSQLLLGRLSTDDVVNGYQKAMELIGETLLGRWSLAYGVKSDAFAEEQETRLILTTVRHALGYKFRRGRNGIVPYISCTFETGDANPIASIMVGPKNRTPNYVIEMLLRQNRMPDHIVSRSAATYQ